MAARSVSQWSKSSFTTTRRRCTWHSPRILVPYHAATHATAASASLRGLAMLNEVITGQAAVIAVIDQFKVLMIAMLVVSPFVLFLRKPRAASGPNG